MQPPHNLKSYARGCMLKAIMELTKAKRKLDQLERQYPDKMEEGLREQVNDALAALEPTRERLKLQIDRTAILKPTAD